MRGANFIVFVREADARAAVAEAYPTAKERRPMGGEDLVFEDDNTQVQIWKYTHPTSPELWVANLVKLTHGDE